MDLKGKKAAGAASTKYMKIAKKMGAGLVVYDNVTNDVYMQDLVNGRTDVIVNDYYLQKMAVAAVKDKYPVKINDGIYSNPYSTSFTFSLKNKTLQEKVNKAIKDMKIENIAFEGICINNINIEIPNEIEKYFDILTEKIDKTTLYVSLLNRKQELERIRTRIKDDNIHILDLIGYNGTIDQKELARISWQNAKIRLIYIVL